MGASPRVVPLLVYPSWGDDYLSTGTIGARVSAPPLLSSYRFGQKRKEIEA